MDPFMQPLFDIEETSFSSDSERFIQQIFSSESIESSLDKRPSPDISNSTFIEVPKLNPNDIEWRVHSSTYISPISTSASHINYPNFFPSILPSESVVESDSSDISEVDEYEIEKIQRRRRKGNQVDITHLLSLPQKEAAKILNVPNSTLCKRWKEVTKNRRWPASFIQKINKDIDALVEELPKDIEGNYIVPNEKSLILNSLLTKRIDLTTPVFIRL